MAENSPRTNPEKANFGSLLKEMRDKAGLTQTALKDKLERDGYPIDVSSISSYESGRRRPPVSLIAYLAQVLKLSNYEEEILLRTYLKETQLNTLEEFIETKSRLAKQQGR